MILMIDDEHREAGSYVEELEYSGFRVHFEKDVDRALRFVTENIQEIELLILDIMMPPGRTLAQSATRNGLRTGVELFHRIREISTSLPIIVLTNVSDQAVEATFLRKANCRFLRKEDQLPFELVEEVRNFLKNQPGSLA